MSVNTESYLKIKKELGDDVTLVAVSKTKPPEDILALYELGHRDFGENYVQELLLKKEQLPSDIRWHFIGHLQSNKVKQIASFIHLIHSTDSVKLLKEINKQGKNLEKKINVLLQLHISGEETKFGFSEDKYKAFVASNEITALEHVTVEGLMGMASLTDDEQKIRNEFAYLRSQFEYLKKNVASDANVLSMGMSRDYHIAIREGSNMLRIGSLLFGQR